MEKPKEPIMLCKYIKREGESCILNNNCKYPKCILKEIHQQGHQYCSRCEKITLHIPKLDAVKAGNRVCNECRKENSYEGGIKI